MTQKSILRIGSRGSDLALAQAHYINHRLKNLDDAPETEIKIIKTTGDKIQDIPLSELGAGKSADDRKGFFTKEIEDALLEGEIDIAVHSFKDMPTLMPEGLVIGCMPQRLNPLDVLVFRKDIKISGEPPYIAPGSRIGTSSVRRISHIEYSWPDMKIVPLRGNVPTRIKKLLDGKEFEAILLSGAGVERLMGNGFFDGFDERLKDLEFISLPPETFIPAPAQGALAIQCRENDEKSLSIIKKLEDAHELETVRSERHVLSELNGGCHLPLGSHCIRENGSFRQFVFLGKEALDNRKNESYAMTRTGKSAEALSRHIVYEIKNKPPVILTGRAERTEELKKISGNQLGALPLIITTGLNPDADLLKNWLNAIKLSKEKSIMAVFSVPGAEHLKRIVSENNISLENLEFAVTGDKTKESLLKHFPGVSIAHLSPDGTGQSLAALLEKNKKSLNNEILAVCAENPRKEFYTAIENSGFKVLKFPVYRTEDRPPAKEALVNLPDMSRIVFASPSAVRAFFSACTRSISEKKEFLFCALGPTTAKEIESAGFEVYAQSVKPDLDILLKELL